VHHALPRPPEDNDSGPPPRAVTGLLSHLDAVYGFALTLTGDVASAAELTEDVFGSVHDDLWATLGGRGLRDRLLARCVTAFAQAHSSRFADAPSAPRPAAAAITVGLSALLRDLPWNERAAIALVDHIGMTYTAGAAVLGTSVADFRALLHRGRAVLFDAHRALAR
jgi:DNA-directed RNA polymerase specialized sigma24 family protein